MAKIPILQGGGVPVLDLPGIRALGNVGESFNRGRLTAERLQDIAEARADREDQRSLDVAKTAVLQDQRNEFGTAAGIRDIAGRFMEAGLADPGMAFLDRARSMDEGDLSRRVKLASIAASNRSGQPQPASPRSTVAKIIADRNARFLTPEQAEAAILKANTPPGTTVNLNAGETEARKAAGKQDVEMIRGPILEAGKSARMSQPIIGTLERIVTKPDFYSGAGGETVQQMRRIGKAMGFDPKGVTDSETFSALVKDFALKKMGGSLGSGFSEGDRTFVEGQVPSLQNTVEGNKQLIEITKKLNQRALQIEKKARDYERKNKRPVDLQFSIELEQWAEENPIFPDVSAPGNNQPTNVTTQAEWDALPSGSLYVDPGDGKTYAKP